MISEIEATIGKKVRFKIGEQDYIGRVEQIFPEQDCLVMYTGESRNMRVTLRLDAIDAILQFMD